MSHNSLSYTSIEDSSDCSLVAKLRRLKIQENLLVNNINKITLKENECKDKLPPPELYNLEFKHFSTKVRNNVAAINTMFHDLNAQTEEELSSQDIGNMKREVINLDDKIRTFKNYLQSELAIVTSKEEELTRQVNDIKERHSISLLGSKTRFKPLSHYIVQSPVKVLIQSPFRCKEVQELQDFMINSPNRYGGWNEYNHNIFVKVWQKYFNSDAMDNELKMNMQDNIIPGNTDNFQVFQRNILQKITGSTKEDILSHHKWYSKYLYLKQQQQNALNKWRKSQRMLSRTSEQYKKKKTIRLVMDKTKKSNSNRKQTQLDYCKDLLIGNDTEKNISSLSDMSFQDMDLSEIDMNSEASSNTSDGTNQPKTRSFSDLLKPTKQWINRCHSHSFQNSGIGYNNLETIKKLRIPDWRLSLED